MTIREALAASPRSAASGMFEGIYPVNVSLTDDGSYEVSIYQMEGQWREHTYKTIDELEAYVKRASSAWNEWKPAM